MLRRKGAAPRESTAPIDLRDEVSEATSASDVAGRVLTRAIAPGEGSAADPRSEEISWVAWRVAGAAIVDSEAQLEYAASLLTRAAEALWLPGRVVLITDLCWDPVLAALEINLLVGVLGGRHCTHADVDAIVRHFDAVLADQISPFAVKPADPGAVLDAQPDAFEHTALIRQRVLDVDLPVGSATSHVGVLTRFNPVLNSSARVARALVCRSAPTRFRATVMPTELGPDERQAIDRQLRDIARARLLLPEHPEYALTLERADATLQDLKVSFASPLLVAEIALASPEPLPETFIRVVGTAITSEVDVLRRGGFTTVAGQRLMLGGFEVELDAAHHREALAVGLPLFGGVRLRSIRDVVSLTECPVNLPVPVGSEIRGLPTTHVKARARTDVLAPTGESGELLLGHDPDGSAISVPFAHRTTHMLVTGVTGSGKTTLLDGAVHGDIAAGRPFLIVDFHGTWYERVRAACTDAGIEPVCFDIHDPQTARLAPIPAYDDSDPSSLEKVRTAARVLCDAFTSHLPNPEWTGPMFHQRSMALLELQAMYQTELLTVLGWLSDPHVLREAIEHMDLSKVAQGVLRSMSSQTSGDGAAGIEWIQSKWSTLAGGPARRLLARPGHGIDIADELFRGRPVLINLAGLSTADSSVMGHVMLQLILDGILARTPEPGQEIAAYIDEAHRVEPHNLARAWAEGRKFGLALTVATQSPLQFPTSVADLALSSGTVVAFRQAPAAAQLLAPLSGVPTAELIAQPNLHAVVKTTLGDACTLIATPYRVVGELPPFGPVPDLPFAELTPEEAFDAIDFGDGD